MTVPFLDMARHVAAIRGELDGAIASTLDAGQFIFGTALEDFERDFAAYCGARHTVGVANGTEALTIALQACEVRPGDEVVTAANTCVPTVAAIEAAGAVPVLADVDELTWTLDPSSVERVLTERTRAIVPVHLYGQCADVAALGRIARDHGLRMIEDAAQAHGAEFQGRRTGTLADAAAFSFYPTKNLGALGDGGAVVSDDPDVAERAALLRNYGERTRYDSIRSGWNSRLDTLQAAVLAAKLLHLETWTKRRREIAAFYGEQLEGCGIGLPFEAEGRRHVYHLYVVRVAARNALRAALEVAGVSTLVHYPRPIHHHPAYAHLARPGLEVSERLSAEIVSLPLFPELRDDEVDVVVAAVRAAA